MKKAVVLLSGGLDSATTLYVARKKGYEIFCLIFDYGQRHKKEMQSARQLAKASGVEHSTLKIALPWKGSALLDKAVPLPRKRKNCADNIPSTYVPSRNTIFLSYALSCAESIEAEAVFIGANAVDYSGYPDCRPEYFREFQHIVRVGTKAGVEGRGIKINVPLLNKTKAQIIKWGMRLKVPYELTWSCYDGGKVPCLTCDSCVLRAKGFKDAGVIDPAIKM